MTIATVSTKEYSIVIDHLELDFYTDKDNATPSKDEQARITAEQVSLPLVVSVDASATKDDIVDVVCNLISERSGWCVYAVDIDWFGSGVDKVDATNLTQEQKGELYDMLGFYTRKQHDTLIDLQREAIEDFISKKLGLDDLDSRVLELLEEQVKFDFHIEGFDADLHHKQQLARWFKQS